MLASQLVRLDRQQFINDRGGIKAARRLYVTTWEGSVPSRYFVFADGSRLDQDELGQNFEPPANKVERLKLVLAYRKIILAEAKESLDYLINQIRFHFDRENFKGTYCGPSYSGSEDKALEELEEQKRKHWNALYAAETVEKELDALLNPPEKIAEKAQYEKQRIEKRQNFFDKFNAVLNHKPSP